MAVNNKLRIAQLEQAVKYAETQLKKPNLTDAEKSAIKVLKFDYESTLEVLKKGQL